MKTSIIKIQQFAEPVLEVVENTIEFELKPKDTATNLCPDDNLPAMPAEFVAAQLQMTIELAHVSGYNVTIENVSDPRLGVGGYHSVATIRPDHTTMRATMQEIGRRTTGGAPQAVLPELAELRESNGHQDLVESGVHLTDFEKQRLVKGLSLNLADIAADLAAGNINVLNMSPVPSLSAAQLSKLSKNPILNPTGLDLAEVIASLPEETRERMREFSEVRRQALLGNGNLPSVKLTDLFGGMGKVVKIHSEQDAGDGYKFGVDIGLATDITGTFPVDGVVGAPAGLIKHAIKTYDSYKPKQDLPAWPWPKASDFNKESPNSPWLKAFKPRSHDLGAMAYPELSEAGGVLAEAMEHMHPLPSNPLGEIFGVQDPLYTSVIEELVHSVKWTPAKMHDLLQAMAEVPALQEDFSPSFKELIAKLKSDE